MSNNLPVIKDEAHLMGVEKMDLSALRSERFVVAVSTGDPEKGRFLSSTIYGPYSFEEMVEEVGRMWQQHHHHAAVTILSKDTKKPPRFLDKNTKDYIEQQWENIIMDAFIAGSLDPDEEFTCRAGINEFDGDEDPRKTKKEEESTTIDSDEL